MVCNVEIDMDFFLIINEQKQKKKLFSFRWKFHKLHLLIFVIKLLMLFLSKASFFFRLLNRHHLPEFELELFSCNLSVLEFLRKLKIYNLIKLISVPPWIELFQNVYLEKELFFFLNLNFSRITKFY